jgi:outer membrane lipoprotein carrier protein
LTPTPVNQINIIVRSVAPTTMKTFFISILLFAVVSANAVAESSKASQGEIFLESFLADTKTLEAGFQQTLRTHDGEILQQTEGRFYLSRPGKFRWNYQSPYEQVIVSDGERIWIYDVELQQVTVQKHNADQPSTPMALLDDNSTGIYQNFNVSPLDVQAGVYRVKLESKTKDSDFAEIVIGVDDKGLRFMQLHDQFEQVTDIVFSDISINTKLEKEIFIFIPPEGVDVFGG